MSGPPREKSRWSRRKRASEELAKTFATTSKILLQSAWLARNFGLCGSAHVGCFDVLACLVCRRKSSLAATVILAAAGRLIHDSPLVSIASCE